MEEKTMIADALSSANAYLNMLNYSILQCDDKNLRDYFIGIRNKFEIIQYEIYALAKQKNFYKPAAPAGKADIEAVKTEIGK